jgi:hypothetical protein
MVLLNRQVNATRGLDDPVCRNDFDNHDKARMLSDAMTKLHDIDKVPSWYAHKAFIFTGYRPITSSIRICILGLTHVHNETVNIYSHLIPALLALLGKYLLRRYLTLRFPNPSSPFPHLTHTTAPTPHFPIKHHPSRAHNPVARRPHTTSLEP